MVKELKHCRTIEELCCSETVKHKAKDYVRKYMAKQGPMYKPESSEEKEKISPKEVSQESGVNHNTVDTFTNDQ
jgi:huntingtin interacting protein, putative